MEFRARIHLWVKCVCSGVGMANVGWCWDLRINFKNSISRCGNNTESFSGGVLFSSVSSPHIISINRFRRLANVYIVQCMHTERHTHASLCRVLYEIRTLQLAYLKAYTYTFIYILHQFSSTTFCSHLLFTFSCSLPFYLPLLSLSPSFSLFLCLYSKSNKIDSFFSHLKNISYIIMIIS